MVRISEIVNQNPWWKHGKKFVLFDKNLKEAKEKPFSRPSARARMMIEMWK